MSDSIGGHNTPEGGLGLEVFRELHEGRSVIVKRAHTDADKKGIIREAGCLFRLQGSDFTPNHLWQTDTEIAQEDLGKGEPVKDGEAFRQNGVRLLWDLRKAEVRHGDLTRKNCIFRGDAPIAIDFQQSNFFNEDAPQKRPVSDSYLLWRWMQNVPSVKHPTPDSPRVIRRWLAVMGELGGIAPNNLLRGKTLLDLGCFQGDFTAMAVADGMHAVGVDQGGFRQGEDSIEIARSLWPDDMLSKGLSFYQRNIVSWSSFNFDAVLLFSTWAYIYHDYGEEVAFELLNEIVQQCGVLFFETQLYGDGPGPEFLGEDQNVAELLAQFGVPKPLVTIPVTGRQAERTVWAVRK